jgi:isopenicillin N synthase-like dioxygenase
VVLRELPVIEVGPLVGGLGERRAVAAALAEACQQLGFFYVQGHGLDPALVARLDALGRRFFVRPEAEKLEIAMARGGRAWRGYFPLGGELTSGQPDRKEGLYFGDELLPEHPRVRGGVPLHGPNLFPSGLPGFRETVLEYLEAMTRLGHALTEGLAESLDLPTSYFRERFFREPLTLFRIFRYPPPLGQDDGIESGRPQLGVGEHTDYGFLTMLLQDEVHGLEVKTSTGWIDAPPLPGMLLCNLGDMLERMTGGRYRSTPHRVRNPGPRERLSFPFFFDPSWDAEVYPVVPGPAYDDRDQRWDGASVFDLRGTYGDYLLAKVSRVFPDLQKQVL